KGLVLILSFNWFLALTISYVTGYPTRRSSDLDPLKAFHGQSHRTGRRHSIHFSATGNEPEAKGLPSEGWCLYELGAHSVGGIFFLTLRVTLMVSRRVSELSFLLEWFPHLTISYV